MKTNILIWVTLLFLLLTVYNSKLICQVIEAWNQNYDGSSSDDAGTSIALDASGNVYVTGESTGFGTGYDIATLKYNSSGIPQWGQRYNGPGNQNDVGYKIAVDPAGNAYVTGTSIGDGSDNDYITIKYNSSGIQQWVQRYNGTGNYFDFAQSLAVDAFGNSYVTGTSWRSSPNLYDCVTIKYNTAGVQQWVQFYNGPLSNSDEGFFIKVDNNGNVYVCGECDGVSQGSSNYFVVKYNSSGVQQWAQIYNGPGNSFDAAFSLTIDPTTYDVYVTGESFGNGSLGDFATIKYNSSGTSQWEARYNGAANGGDDAYFIMQDQAGYIYVSGQSQGSGSGWDYLTIKYNTAGFQQWIQRYNGTGNGDEALRGMTVSPSGEVHITGISFGSGSDYNFATVKYSTSGLQQWVQVYNGLNNSFDGGTSIAIDASNNIYVTGTSTTNTGRDYTTIKYEPSPYIVNLLQPSDNSTVPVNPKLSWHSVLNSLSYNLQISSDSLFDHIIFDFPGIEDTLRIVDGLEHSNPYWWRVRAVLPAAPGPWSEIWKFTIEQQTTVPFILDKIEILKHDVDSLVHSGRLFQLFGNILKNNLRGAANQLSNGHNNLAIIRMQLFNSEVAFLIELNFLQQQCGQPLIASGNEIITLIQSLNDNLSTAESDPLSNVLKQNFPNPFNPKTKISFSIPKTGMVKLIIYDITGREVARLIDKEMNAGSYIVDFDASSFSSGVYFYKLISGGNVFTKKMVLIK